MKYIKLDDVKKIIEIISRSKEMDKGAVQLLLDLAVVEMGGEKETKEPEKTIRKEKPKRKSKRWTEENDEELLKLEAEGKELTEIAKQIGRTEGSVRMRLKRMPEKIKKEMEEEEEAFGNVFRSADVALMMNCSSYQLKKVAELVEAESGKFFQRAEDTRERLYTWEDTKLLKRVHELIQKGNRRNESVQLALEEKRNREKAEEEKGQ